MRYIKYFGAGISALILVFTLFGTVFGATNISSSATEHWAWNDVIGWIDFYTSGTVTVGSSKVEGYASSSVGDISFDCATTRDGDICSRSNYKVTNDGLGTLSGWAWNDTYGWISLDCHNNDGCATSNYQAYVDPTTGQFQNYAWNDVLGWISFNCANYAGCGSSNYKVVTAWTSTSTSGMLDSTTYDTGVSGGAQINSLMWHGSQPAGTSVHFQFATANASSGPWNYRGSDGTASTYYSTGPDVSLGIDYSLFNNQRYFRYRVTLTSNQAQSLSPRVDEVIVNWSP